LESYFDSYLDSLHADPDVSNTVIVEPKASTHQQQNPEKHKITD